MRDFVFARVVQHRLAAGRLLAFGLALSGALLTPERARACGRLPYPTGYDIRAVIPSDGSSTVARDAGIVVSGVPIGGYPDQTLPADVRLFDVDTGDELPLRRVSWSSLPPSEAAIALYPVESLAAQHGYRIEVDVATGEEVEAGPIVSNFVTSDALLDPLVLSGELELSLRGAMLDVLVQESTCPISIPTGETRRALMADVKLPVTSGGQGIYRGVLAFSHDTPVLFSGDYPASHDVDAAGAQTVRKFLQLEIDGGEVQNLTQELFEEDFEYAGCFSFAVWDPAGHLAQTSTCLPSLSLEEVQALAQSEDPIDLATDLPMVSDGVKPATAETTADEAGTSLGGRAERGVGCALGAGRPNPGRGWLALLSAGLVAQLARRRRTRTRGGQLFGRVLVGAGIPVPRTVLRTALVACVGLGCGSEADDAPDVPLCDGSDGLNLRVFYEGGGQALGAPVWRENGSPSLAVDGQCEYFMSGGWSGTGTGGPENEWRHGTLDPELRRSLERITDPAALSNECDPGSVPDAPTLVVANARASSACVRQGSRATALLETLREWSPRLWGDAEPTAQDLHLVAWEDALRPEIEPYVWPSALPLRDYLDLDRSSSAGQSTLVSAADAPPLRALRDQFLRDAQRAFLLNDGMGIPVRDGDLTVRLFLRDALPYEDDRGLWPLPGE